MSDRFVVVKLEGWRTRRRGGKAKGMPASYGVYDRLRCFQEIGLFHSEKMGYGRSHGEANRRAEQLAVELAQRLDGRCSV